LAQATPSLAAVARMRTLDTPVTPALKNLAFAILTLAALALAAPALVLLAALALALVL